MKKAAICILGCRVNQSEGESFMEYFKENGYEITEFEEKADIYLIHTCTVTSQADSKSRQMIRKARKNNPDAKVIVTGCYAQTEPGKLMGMPEVDLVVGMRDRNIILDLLDKKKTHIVKLDKAQKFEDMKLATPETTRAFLKIQEGCESFCSYCIIPMARGPIKSRSTESIIDEIRILTSKNYKEVVLTGIHAGAFGKDTGTDLTQLMKRILKETEVQRIRFGSLDPNEINEEFIEVFKDGRFMPHIHLALQSGSDKVLKRMNRKYDTGMYRKVINELRSIKGDKLSVTTDIMVGFPGETEEEHQESIKFIEEMKLDNLHIFKYSKRKGTRAAAFPDQVDDQVKKKRANDMAALRDRLHNEFLDSLIGKKLSVLVEKTAGSRVEGYGENYVKVVVYDEKNSIKDNTIIDIVVLSREKKILTGGLA